MTQTAAVPAPQNAPKARAPRWRRWTAGFLIVLSCILAPLSVISIWVRNIVLNTDRYVETVAPLSTNPAVIDTAATNITNALFDNVDVEKEIEDAFPPRADFLAAPLATGLRTVVDQAAVRILSSDQFDTVWKNANRRAHTRLVKVLTGKGTLQTENDKVVLDLTPLVDTVKAKLDDRGIRIFDKIPANKALVQLNIIDAQQLEKVRSGTKLLNTLSWVLPILCLACLGGGLALSSNRRRSLFRWGIWVAVAVALVGAGVAIGRSIYLDAVTSPDLPRDTAAAVFDTLVRFLRYGIRLIIALGLVVALAAWLTGPTRAATGIRSTAKRIVGGAGASAGERGVTFGAFGAWVARYRAGLRIAAVLLALVTLLLWNQPRGGTVLFLAIVLLIVLAMIEFVGRAGASGVSGEGPAPPVGASPA
jgi:hypothetical protein